MPKSCNHLGELRLEQKLLIERHVKKHKYYSKIEDEAAAVIDIIDKYLWVAREAFCDLCPEGKSCEAYKIYLEKNPEIDKSLKGKLKNYPVSPKSPENLGLFGNELASCNHLGELIKELSIIAERHVEKHKYYNHIEDKNAALIDLAQTHLWVAREIFCDLCPESKTCRAYQSYLKNNPEIDESLKPK